MAEGTERFQSPRFARAYERTSVESERRGTAEHRNRTLAGLTGRVIEVGAGNGLNFARYPPTVTEVLAVEPENHLRALAEQAARRAPIPIRVTSGHAEALPAEDAAFDAAVLCLVLCSVPDPARSLRELRRVLKPGGDLRFFEHVRSPSPWLGLVEDLVTPLWSRLAGGCHLNRDAAETIHAAGFSIEWVDRFAYSPARLSPSLTHVVGRARS